MSWLLTVCMLWFVVPVRVGGRDGRASLQTWRLTALGGTGKRGAMIQRAMVDAVPGQCP